jgi:putative ABC transport system permease protein
VIRGRAFTAQDRFSTEELAILDEVLARRLFPDEEPLGKRIRIGGTGAPRTIVGVTRPAKNAGLAQADDPEFYALWRIRPDVDITRAHILLRSDAEAAELASYVRAEIARIDPTVPVTVTTMESNLARLTERPRIQTRLLSAFALVGLLLAAIGQFGLVSYIVTQRTPEIGLRMALGATPRHVLRLVASRVGAWTAAGAVIGLALSMWLGRYVEPLLFGVTPRDPATAIVVLIVLAAVSLVAAAQPALRATGVQPASALRHE